MKNWLLTKITLFFSGISLSMSNEEGDFCLAKLSCTAFTISGGKLPVKCKTLKSLLAFDLPWVWSSTILLPFSSSIVFGDESIKKNYNS